MRIVALTFGTEGDSRPMVALCRGLLDAGHEATLLAEPSAASCANAHSVPFASLAGDMAAELRSAADGVLRNGGDFTRVSRVLAGIANRNTSEWMRTTLQHADGADALLCAGLAIYVGLSCAEHLRIPAIGVGLQPMMPTRDFPSPFLPQVPMPGWMNRLSHRLVLTLMWRAFRDAVNEARRDVSHQPPRRRQWNGYPVLCAMSSTLVAKPRDWPRRFSMVGYLWPPPDPDWAPDPSLAAFLASGEAPVYVGFGSMLGFDRDRMLSIVLEALDGRRALLFGGWSGFGDGALAHNMRRIGPVPHTWLFPRTSIVVHHGGAGTTHTAARAGVPSVVLPFAADQFFWAERLRRMGIAPHRLTHAKLTARHLRERLKRASDAGMRERARAVGEAMAREDGVAAAVRHVEHWVRAAEHAT